MEGVIDKGASASRKISLTGAVQLELVEAAFREAGFDVARPGEVASVIWDVTSADPSLAREVPGFYDDRLNRLAGCPYSLAGIEAHVEEFRWWLSSPARAGLPGKKVLAVDADNTLWRGILSEDGADAIEAYETFQHGLRELRDRGVLIVLLTKNDEPGFFESVGRGNPLVTESLFARFRINWSPKAGNLADVCRELGVGIDSVVFLDDNPYERAQMSSHLPEVEIAPWKGWTDGSECSQRQLVRRLKECYFFDAGLTAEDRLRSDDYRRQATIGSAHRDFPTHGDYLKFLGLWVEVRSADEKDLDRLAQMAGKTNQFNATTIRRSREDFSRLLADSRYRVFVFRAGDRFGEQGIVLYIVVDLAQGRITDFVMSCRAMGRTLEHFALRHVRRECGSGLGIDFVPTAKNRPFESFLKSLSSDEEMVTFYSSPAPEMRPKLACVHGGFD